MLWAWLRPSPTTLKQNSFNHLPAFLNQPSLPWVILLWTTGALSSNCIWRWWAQTAKHDWVCQPAKDVLNGFHSNLRPILHPDFAIGRLLKIQISIFGSRRNLPYNAHLIKGPIIDLLCNTISANVMTMILRRLTIMVLIAQQSMLV